VSTLTLDNNSLLFKTPYHTGLVADLKARIPSTARVWDNATKTWRIAPGYAQVVVDLVAQYQGERLTAPALPAVIPATETRLLEVRYLGMTKERGEGDATAFGWCDGAWSVIFPETVLRAWFCQEAQPDQALTLYATLGCQATATLDVLKSAYRRLARQWHPDVCREPNAAEQFKMIHHAWELLSDEKLRRRYDAGLALAATLARQAAAQDDLFKPGYRAPLRCGYVLAEGQQQLTRFVVSTIMAWEDIVNARGQVLSTSWALGAQTFTESWL
jgi:hypothetical protein